MTVEAKADASRATAVQDEDVARHAGVADESGANASLGQRWFPTIVAVVLVVAFTLVVALGVTVTGRAWPLIVVPIGTLFFLFAPQRLARNPLVRASFPFCRPAIVSRAWLDDRKEIAEIAALYCDFLAESGMPRARLPDKPLPIPPQPEPDRVLVDTLVEIGMAAVTVCPTNGYLGKGDISRFGVMASGEFLYIYKTRRRGAIKELAARGWNLGSPFAELMVAYREASLSVDVSPRRTALGKLVQEGRTEPKAPIPRETQIVRKHLGNSEWPPEMVEVVEEGMEDAAVEQQALVTISANAMVDRALQSLLVHVNVDTFQRFLETRRMIGYLITFDGTQGHLGNLLDAMPDGVDPQGNPKYQEVGGPRYNFVKYQNSNRLGVVPRNLTLVEFSEKFETDFLASYEKARETEEFKDSDVTLQRFRLGQQFFVVTETAHAVRRLGKVTADAFTAEERAALLGYYPDQDFNVLAGVLYSLTLCDAADGVNITGHKQALKTADERIRGDLLTWSKLKRLGDLSKQCAKKEGYAAQARTKLAQLITRACPGMSDDLANIVADKYVDALVTVGNVYE